MKTILNKDQLSLTILRLSHQLIEELSDADMKDLVFIGIQPRGVLLGDRIMDCIKAQAGSGSSVQYGKLDITFYRDDVRKELHIPSATRIDFSIEGKKVILIDDVLYTGRTVRAALDALLDFGRPAQVSLCVLIDRRFSRELPIQPDYCGLSIDTLESQEVKVSWDRSCVELF